VARKIWQPWRREQNSIQSEWDKAVDAATVSISQIIFR
jgi:hypothetical protein